MKSLVWANVLTTSFMIAAGLFMVLAFCQGVNAETLTAEITIDAASAGSQINRMLFGNNILWSQISRNMQDPNNPSLGIRSDILDLLKELQPGALRFPGGSLASVYRWRNGVGPIDPSKPGHRLPIDDRISTAIPFFGTDEFVDLCTALNVTDMVITVNYCTDTPQEAANWVEYCNGRVPATPDPNWRVDSYKAGDKAPKGYFAWLRAQFGHPEPYNIKWWEIGNEVYHEIANGLVSDLTPAQYGSDIRLYATLMKQIDPKIKIGAAIPSFGNHVDTAWVDDVLANAGTSIDFVTPHYYSTLCKLSFDCFYSNRTSQRSLLFAATGLYTIKITARADIPSAIPDVPAIMEVRLDGRPLATFSVWQYVSDYIVETWVTEGSHTLSISFNNDYYDPANKQDRNLFVYVVTRRSTFQLEESIWYPPDTEQQLLLQDYQEVSNHLQYLRYKLKTLIPNKTIQIFPTEGSLCYSLEGSCAVGYPTNEVPHSLRYKAVLWLTNVLNALIRNQVQGFCAWNLFDTGHFGAIRDPYVTAMRTSPLRAPSYYALQLYAQMARMSLLSAQVNSPRFAWPVGTPPPTGFDAPYGAPFLDAISGRSHKVIRIIATNRSRHELITTINIQRAKVLPTVKVSALHVVALQPHPELRITNPDLWMDAYCETRTAWNDLVSPDDIRVDKTIINSGSNKFQYRFEPYSVSLLELSVK
ncbi:MAG: hypothetical protein K6U00_08620 [Armatimonadetes bacterium]|nr:hypothetical protein [Armatimonadota bacterium]